MPTVAGAVCVAYNVPGAPPNLKLDGDVIANMFLGKITAWNDPQIAALNPGVTLPATKLTPFHRSDGSGTRPFEAGGAGGSAGLTGSTRRRPAAAGGAGGAGAVPAAGVVVAVGSTSVFGSRDPR